MADNDAAAPAAAGPPWWKPYLSDPKVQVVIGLVVLNGINHFTTCYRFGSSMVADCVARTNQIFVLATLLACVYLKKSPGAMSQTVAEKIFLFGKVLAVVAVLILLYLVFGDFGSCPGKVPDGAVAGATVTCKIPAFPDLDGTTTVLPEGVKAGDYVNCDCKEDCGCDWWDWLTGCAWLQLIAIYNCGVAGTWLYIGYQQTSALAAASPAGGVPAAAAASAMPQPVAQPSTATDEKPNPTYGAGAAAGSELAQTSSFNVDDFDLSAQSSADESIYGAPSGTAL
jgi:hypothetical protein